jgi:sirohydrochlorin ferrochelatase
MTLILAAHGTRRPQGVAMIGDLAAQVSWILNRRVQVAFVDVLGPTPGEALSSLARAVPDEHAIVVPAFLSRGYHVRTDLPAHVAASGHPNVVLTPALGPSVEITRILVRQLVECGWRSGDSIVLAAAGTSDPRARADLHSMATMLSRLTASPVQLGFAAMGSQGVPTVRDAVKAARAEAGARAHRVAVASYLLADGLFQERLHDSGADLVSRPLGTHPGLAWLLANRFRGTTWPMPVAAA